MKLSLLLSTTIVGLIASASAFAQGKAKQGLTVDDMLAMQRISSHVPSPDGKQVVFAVRTTDIAANKGRFDLWLAKADGSGVRQLTKAVENDTDPQWSPDGNHIYFVSNRGGSSQVWRIAIGGGEAERVTDLPLDVGGYKLFPDGKQLVVALEVWPTARTIAASIALDEAKAKEKSSARVYDQLLFRHWDSWEDGRFSHLFVWTPPELGGKANDAVDITVGQYTDSPTHPFGGMEEVEISKDGKTVFFVARSSGNANAWSTNTDIFAVAADGKGKPTNLTADNPAYDFAPTLSPDGKSLAMLSMKRAGYEADRQRIRIYDLATKSTRVVTEKWDRSPNNISWSSDGKTLYSSADNLGNQSIFAVDVATGAAKVLIEKGNNDAPKQIGTRLLFARDTLSMPVELFTSNLDGSNMTALTQFNAARVANIKWGSYEQFSFKGSKQDTVWGYVMAPPGHDGKKKVPVAMIIHGGPQGSMGDHFHYRWNPQAFAARGFAVVFIDFHGSTGYGQEFTDAINHNWGAGPFEDLMKGLDAALTKYSYLDGKRAVALGASYGGYMINWINGHTDRFKALVAHAGNLDERLAYYDTEELWFPEWEHGGVPWEKPEGYTKENPIDFVKNWKTPTLVVHGALDFRVVESQGMSTFTALQRKGVPSRFVHFPDENHWILKPHNSKKWHEEVFRWIEKFAN